MRDLAFTRHPFHAVRPRRGASVFGFFILLLIVGIFVGAYFLSGREEKKKVSTLAAHMSEPRPMLERFFLECSRKHDYKSRSWQVLLEMQSSDDQAWLQQNLLALAGKNMRMPGVAAGLATEPEQQYAALEELLRFGEMFTRPVVSTIEVQGAHAVGFYHQAHDPQSLRPVFLRQETDNTWRVMRFLGARDRMVPELAVNKQDERLPLDADERLYLSAPERYEAAKLGQLYALVGLQPPMGGGVPAASPAAAPAPVPAASGSADPTPLPE